MEGVSTLLKEPVLRRLRQCKAWRDSIFDRWYGLESELARDGNGRQQVAAASGERTWYEPSRWLALYVALRRGDVSRDDVFADLGSGKGRVVIQAARRYPFRRVIGVELSKELTDSARESVERNRGRLRCENVELVSSDVLEWNVPDDLSIAYLYNPVRGESFSRLVERLLEVVNRRGRHMRIIYLNPEEHGRLMACGQAVRLEPRRGPLARIARLPPGALAHYELRPAR